MQKWKNKHKQFFFLDKFPTKLNNSSIYKVNTKETRPIKCDDIKWWRTNNIKIGEVLGLNQLGLLSEFRTNCHFYLICSSFGSINGNAHMLSFIMKSQRIFVIKMVTWRDIFRPPLMWQTNINKQNHNKTMSIPLQIRLFCSFLMRWEVVCIFNASHTPNISPAATSTKA